MKIKSNPINGVELEGKILVMKESSLGKQYRTLNNRLHRATGGFGCGSENVGRAVFTECLGDGEKTRWSRSDFEGWLTEEEASALIKKETGIAMEEFLMWRKLSND